MSLRLKVFSVIVSVVALVTAANMGMSLYFAQARLLDTVESDMSVVADIADELITNKINLLKVNAAAAARQLAGVSDAALRDALREQLYAREDFTALTVLDPAGPAVSYGDMPTRPALLDADFLRRAFAGEEIISTTWFDPDAQRTAFSVCAPMGDRVLAATIPGQLFSDLLRHFKVWDTGNIFILDAEGTLIANCRSEQVERRSNYIEIAKTNPDVREAGAFSSVMIGGGRGVGRYAFDGVERLCAYSSITGSKVGWVLGVAAPLSESPAAHVRQGLMMSACLFLLVGVLIAAFASGALAKPFRRIEEQNLHLAELNAIAKNASEGKSRFLANMSHEMRTPLNAVVGLSELMLGEDTALDETGENLEKIHNAGMTLLGIVNDILDISKIESGKFTLMPVEYDVPSLINDTITLNIMRIGDKPIRFALDADASLPSRLFGDELRVKQICNNLLSNAFKYTKAGEVRWFVGCERDGDDVWLTVRVTDSGIGIREADIEKLFSDYNQVDTKSNRRIEGTGLGLSITKMMAEMMDGDIAAESEYGKGSVFTARIRQGFVTDIPIGEEVAENLKRFRYCDNKRSENAKLVRIKLPYARVLVVDDVQTNLDVARGMIKPYDMQVDCVTSGPQAIERIRAGQVVYNAIFMDHMMPVMVGIETVRVIREEIGTDYARNIPIIALTANALIGNEKMFLENGFQAFISKPIDIMQLDAVVRRWLRNKDLEEDRPLTREEDAPPAGAAVPVGALAIDGIDAAGCLERFGGDVSALLEVLRSYAAHTAPLLEKLRQTAREDLPAYAIIVHGIKGSSRGVCAAALADMAEALERAAKAGDADFVEANNGGLVEAAERLLERLRAALGSLDAAEPKAACDAPDAALLARLAACCERYDMDGIDEAMTALEAFSYETQADLVAWLREQIDRMEFGAVRDRLKEGSTAA
ncbi:MAG: response regulator [Clostridiales Family XIII bacterium]|jgi:signal transduction histidine kinase/FixJ family two-component response regulator/HPt (histidine-containing phosphotransfer) domain-containing protein|nr:response regulator [Clostridiales Family XIII bacterium]